MADRPEVDVQQVEGPPAQVKVTQAESFGLRIELRLAERYEDASEVLLQVHASCPADSD